MSPACWRWRALAGVVLLPLMLAACETRVPVPAVTPPVDAQRAQAHWSRVLERFVDDQGRVDFVTLARQRQDLDAYVAWIAAVGPDSHPLMFGTDAERLAYHLNAYNALSMYNMLEAGLPRDLSGLTRVDFFVLRTLRIGGRSLSLYDYEKEVIRPLGEPRVHFALNCMAVSCPRLPRTPFQADTLDADLDTETRRFFSEPRNLLVDATARTVTFNEILDFYTEDFLAVAPSLQSYASRYRADPLPEDYGVRFAPYDWRVNHQP